MTALRTTRFNPDRWWPTGAIAAWAVSFGVVLTGAADRDARPRASNEPETGPPALTAVRDRPGAALPAPDSDRIEYDARTRTLHLYDPPDSARWMVHLSNARHPAPVGPQLRLPEGIDPDRTVVFYTRPGGGHSTPVSLRQIQDARDVHRSTNP